MQIVIEIADCLLLPSQFHDKTIIYVRTTWQWDDLSAGVGRAWTISTTSQRQSTLINDWLEEKVKFQIFLDLLIIPTIFKVMNFV